MLKESFQAYDKSHSGKVSTDMFVRCLSQAQMKTSEREVSILVSELDPKGEGEIGYDEFLNACFLSYIFLKEYKLRLLFE
jgi:Ca2+-binding EF-hand superfamily protein